MATEQDPVQEKTDGSMDLYDIATWETRSHLDGLSVFIYNAVHMTARVIVILLALVILLAQLALGGLGATLADTPIVIFILFSIAPALLLAAYVRYADVTTAEPLSLLVGTFALGVLFAGFAGVLNSLFQPIFGAIPVIGTVFFFYLVVGPVEETVKLLAVRLYPYRNTRFDAVIDGAVYGAVAGLGFATIENAIYIAGQVNDPTIANVFVAGGGITPLRALAGPGHVIYSAIAGYYLGLAKFNPDRAGPIVVKGLLIAVLVHATYNTLSAIVPGLITLFIPGIPSILAFLGFVLVYDTIFGLYLYRKLARYRAAYRSVNAG
ncbi:PrsW family intramembrane metalloprotease [Halococcus sp. AFM35]|uniref:PrsW family intramembrane metalloprotease n=1 Tax=Halococcus sp. AFM35 TaxID=3421653 RepID=UPI003EBED6E3